MTGFFERIGPVLMLYSFLQRINNMVEKLYYCANNQVVTRYLLAQPAGWTSSRSLAGALLI